MKRRVSKKSGIVWFIYFYFCFFGPRLLGIIDLSVIANVFAIIIVLSTHKRPFDKSYYRNITLVSFLIGLYSLVLSFYYQNLSDGIVFTLKFIRSGIACFAIPNILMLKGDNDASVIEYSIIKVLALHAVIILAETLIFPDLQLFLSPISGYERDAIYPFRGTGLTNGYDFAGVLCCFGLVMVLNTKRIRFELAFSALFYVSSLLTSRFNILLSTAVVFYFIVFKRTINKLTRISFVLLFLVLAIPGIGIVLYTIGYRESAFVAYLTKNNSLFEKLIDNIVWSYADSDASTAIANHYDFSGLNPSQFFFGAMTSSKQDPGYTDFIFRIGLFGLFLAILFYFVLFRNAYKFCKKTNERNVVFFFIAVCLLFSLKNSYILARHVTECILAVYGLGVLKSENANNIDAQINNSDCEKDPLLDGGFTRF